MFLRVSFACASFAGLLTAGCGGNDGAPDGGFDASPVALSCGLDPIVQATNPGPESCEAIEPRCPVAPTANYRNLFKVETCSFKPGMGETSCTLNGEAICAARNGADVEFLIIDPASACPGHQTGKLDFTIGDPGPAGAIGGDWHLFEYTSAPECAPQGETDTGRLDLSGVCCDTQADVSLPLHGQLFRLRIQRDWEAVAPTGPDGGTSTSCADVCAHVSNLCDVPPDGCESSCAARTEQERACMIAAQTCPDVSACVSH